MKNFRITKYNLKKRDKQDRYLVNDWTSISDLFKKYKYEDAVKIYKDVEDKFIEVYTSIFSENKIEKMIINSLALYLDDEDADYIEKRSFDLNLNDLSWLTDKSEISGKQIEDVLKLLLRGLIWCKLDWEIVYLHYGDDYYTYIGGVEISDELINNAKKSNIYIEICDSPCTSEAVYNADILGFTRTNFRSHDQEIFVKDGVYITLDAESHNGSVWKMATSVDNLKRKNTRIGSYDKDLIKVAD